MYPVKVFTNDGYQIINFPLDDGSIVNFSLTYVPSQKGWFYSFTYQSFTVYGRRLVNSYNLIREFRNILPFGLRLDVIDGFEPININDFVSGRINFFVLNANDCILTENYIGNIFQQYLSIG